MSNWSWRHSEFVKATNPGSWQGLSRLSNYAFSVIVSYLRNCLICRGFGN